MQNLTKQLIKWRREFHKYPETGFLEIRTASIIAGILYDLGYELKIGREVMSVKDCMGKPDISTTKKHYNWAVENGANLQFVDAFKDGFTGIVATLDTHKQGKTSAFRFDMDALDIQETDEKDHFPNINNFSSRLKGKMHACGHDAHMSIGLGLATLIIEQKDQLTGVIKLIFQPAEEGTRGAKSMVEAGVVDDVDYFIAGHIGFGVDQGCFLAANNGFLATSKLDISFNGKAAHAGARPEEGRNALLAAASAALNIHAIARHSNGSSRVNVGEFNAGTCRNIIPSNALLKIETRGANTKVDSYIKHQVESIVAGAALMYQVDYTIDLVGEAIECLCSDKLAEVLFNSAKNIKSIDSVTLKDDSSGGSEDALFFMDRVKNNGGLATYCIFGSKLAAGHHNEKFDINEKTLVSAVEILFSALLQLNND